MGEKTRITAKIIRCDSDKWTLCLSSLMAPGQPIHQDATSHAPHASDRTAADHALRLDGPPPACLWCTGVLFKLINISLQ